AEQQEDLAAQFERLEMRGLQLFLQARIENPEHRELIALQTTRLERVDQVGARALGEDAEVLEAGDLLGFKLAVEAAPRQIVGEAVEHDLDIDGERQQKERVLEEPNDHGTWRTIFLPVRHALPLRSAGTYAS